VDAAPEVVLNALGEPCARALWELRSLLERTIALQFGQRAAHRVRREEYEELGFARLEPTLEDALFRSGDRPPL
jgi:hypothetical protein